MKKSLTRLLGLTLAFIMTLSTFSISYATENKASSGQILKALGLIKGNEKGDLLENSTITRAEAAQIVCNIMNWTLEPVSKYNFDDWTWAKQQAATLVKHKITTGVGNNKFGGDQHMDLLQVYAWIYAAVTGDTNSAWHNPDLLLKILPSEKVALAKYGKGNNIKAKRSEIFDSMLFILTSEQGDNKTQIQILIEAKVVQKSVAEHYGLLKKLNPEPEKPEEPKEPEIPASENFIVDVKLLNLREAKVTFSAKASSDVTHYKFDNQNAKAVTLTNNNKEAIVLLPNTLKSQQKVTFNYVNGAFKFEKKDLSIIDGEIPKVVGIRTSNKGELTLTFSEAIKPDSPIQVRLNNGMIYASVKSISENGRDVLVNVFLAEDGKTYNIEISGATDYAGLRMDTQTFNNYKYEALKVPVTVQIKEASSNIIDLTISTPIVTTQAELRSMLPRFRHVSQQPVIDAILSPDKKEIRLILADGSRGYPAPGGDWYLNITDADKIFVDSWGNTSSSSIKLPFTVIIDTTAPTVTMKPFKQEDEKIILVFNEAVTGADSYSTYEIVGADGAVITNAFRKSTPIEVSNSKEYTLAIDKEAFKTENVTLKIKKGIIKDNSYNYITNDVKFSFQTKFMRKLTASVKAVRSNTDTSKTSKLYVSYTNDMLTEVLNPANWGVLNGEISSIVFDGNSRKDIIITLKSDLTIAGLVLETKAITDVNGNKLGNLTFGYVFPPMTNNDIVGNTTKATAKAVDSQYVDITIEGRITGGYEAEAFYIGYLNSNNKTVRSPYVRGVDVKTIDNKTYTIITVGLPEEFKLDSRGLNANKQIEITAKGLILNSDVTLADITVTVADGVSPMVTSVVSKSAAASSVVLKLSEVISNPLNTYFSSELNVKYNNVTLIAGIDYEAIVQDDQLILSLKTKANGGNLIERVEKYGEVYVELTKPSVYIKDTTGNQLKAFAQNLILD